MTAASARALPFATSSIGALLSMSTLMHIPAVAIEATMLEIARVLAPDATVAVGVWGRPDVEHHSERDTATPSTGRRLFSRRSERSWRSLLEIVGRVDAFDVWEDANADNDAFRYHMAFVTAT